MQKFYKIDITGAGENVIVPAIPDRKIRVTHYTFVSDTSCLVTFKSNTTALTGPMSIVTDGGIATVSGTGSNSGGEGVFGLFETNGGEALILSNDAGNIGGHITVYII